MIDVSVLITTFNGGLTVKRAIKSALNQPELRIQVCVCDDASTDDTKDLLRDIAESDPFYRVKVTGHTENKGTAAGYNKAAGIATGKYHIILGDDDFFAPNALYIMASMLDMNQEIDFVYGRTQHFGMRNHLYTPPPTYNEVEFWSGYVSLYGVMYRREAWDLGARYHDLLTLDSGRMLGACDYDFTLQLIERGYKGLCLPDVTVLNYCYMPRQSQTAKVDANQGELVAKFKERWAKWQGEML